MFNHHIILLRLSDSIINILSIPKLPRLLKAPVARPVNTIEARDEAVSNTTVENLSDDQKT